MQRVNTKHKKWVSNQMKLAINAVRSKEMGYLEASKLFAVPKTTSEDHVKETNKTPEQLVAVSIGRKSILSAELEEDLVAYCLEMDRRFYGHGFGDIKRLAYQLAIRNGLRHPFSHESGAASEKCLKEFSKRN
ncbi:hypothetical protein JTB14_033989 [Gonioctena quinquepunctata]|nr:hypothetical protein JTB14_033989 [Gonioctena quinquepunctata]